MAVAARHDGVIGGLVQVLRGVGLAGDHLVGAGEGPQVAFGAGHQAVVHLLDVSVVRVGNRPLQVLDIDLLDGSAHQKGVRLGLTTLFDELVIQRLQFGVGEDAHRVVAHRVFDAVAVQQEANGVHVLLFGVADMREDLDVPLFAQGDVHVSGQPLFLTHPQQVCDLLVIHIPSGREIRQILGLGLMGCALALRALGRLAITPVLLQGRLGRIGLRHCLHNGSGIRGGQFGAIRLGGRAAGRQGQRQCANCEGCNESLGAFHVRYPP